jgi:hypothetical protein
MKYDIKILPLTKSNIEKFDDYNNGFNENFTDLGLKKNLNRYIEDLVKNFRTHEYFNNDALVGGMRRGYTVSWLASPTQPVSPSSDGTVPNTSTRAGANPESIIRSVNSVRTGLQAASTISGAVRSGYAAMTGGGMAGGVVAVAAASLMDFAANAAMANALNERAGGVTYTIDNYRTERGNTDIKDPYIDGPFFSFIYSMLKMRMGTILLGQQGFRKFIRQMNNRSGDDDFDENAVIDDAAIERAMNLTLQNMTDLIGEPNAQYEGVVGANAAANLGAGMLTNLPILNLFLTNPRFEFTITNPTTGEEHTWSQGSLIGASPPWGRDCEDGWDWGSCSCSTVSTDDINTSMSIWDKFNTNDCEYFGRDKFNPHFSERYPEGRYYCDNSIHQIRTHCPNANVTRDAFSGAVHQKLFCEDSTTELDNIIAEQKGNENWCESNPNAVKHQKCTDSNCNFALLRSGDGKLNINYENVGFSANSAFRDKNFPVPPIIHYNGGAYHPGMGDDFRDECGSGEIRIKKKEDDIWRKNDGTVEDSGYEAEPLLNPQSIPSFDSWQRDNAVDLMFHGPRTRRRKYQEYLDHLEEVSRFNGRTELGNHLFYKFNSNNTDTTPRCSSINDRNCNPCHNVKQDFCGNQDEWPWGRYAMCEWNLGRNKCVPKPDYQINFSGTNVQGGSYFDASFKIDESLYKYDRDGDGDLSKHPRYNQYAKYIDCRRHGLEHMQCFNPNIMEHLEKWCDALGIPDGYEGWNDDSFGTDYRYNIMKIDMIPDAFTDYTIMDYNNLDSEGLPNYKHKASWIGLQKPRALGYSTYKIAPWEKPFGGFNGHTDAMPGGNYATTNLGSESDRLLFLNRGYCPTRYHEDGASRYPSRELNNYDDPIAFGFGPYSPHSHKAAGSLEEQLTGSNLGVCTYLNYRVAEHTKVLSQWLTDHNNHHKILPSFELVNNAVAGTSRCNFGNVNNAINRLELCRRYGIGGSGRGQIYFLDPSFIYTNDDRICNNISSDLCTSENSTCELEDGECQSRIGNLIRRNHGSHLFERCNANTIMDFENTCERLNIPVYQSSSTRLFSSYKCNARDVVKRFEYCNRHGVDISKGEICDETLFQVMALQTKNQALTLQINRNTWYALVLNSISQRREQSITALQISQEIEVQYQMQQNQDLVDASREAAQLEQDTMLLESNAIRKEEFNRKAEKARLCVLWNLGDSENEPLKKQSPIRDPFNRGVVIRDNNRIKEINRECNSYKEPFPKKIVFSFIAIILIILIIAFFKTK